jgi:hypothetical protein
MSVRPFSSVGACSNTVFGVGLFYVESSCFSRRIHSMAFGLGNEGHNVTCLNMGVFYG